MAFLLWRFRQFLGSVMSLSIWTILFSQQTSLFSYSQDQMITYIFVVSILQSVILTSALQGLAMDVYSGKISTLLLKPIGLFQYFSVYEAADKLLNLSFILGEAVILYLWFQPVLTFPSFFHSLLFLMWIAGGVCLHFFITLIFGAIGFWSPDVWGAKFVFFMIIDFTAGKLYPLDILPQFIQTLIYATPFPYLSFAQSQLFLGRLSSQSILQQSFVLLFWTVSLGFLAHLIWKNALKSYVAAGQ